MTSTDLFDRLSPIFDPPYYAVIFSTLQSTQGLEGYEQTAEEMVALAQRQDGYLGIESVHDADGVGITVSYWRDEEAISSWKKHADHAAAREAGRGGWYRAYRLRVARVERAYDWEAQD